jgi:hypothetical protein
LGASFELDTLAEKPLAEPVAGALLQRQFDVLDDGAERAVQCGLGLFDGEPRLEAGEKIDPVVAAFRQALPARGERLAHADGNEDGRRRAKRGAAEVARGNTDNGERHPVNEQGFVQKVGILVEPLGPIGVAENGQPVGAGCFVVGRGQQAA